MSFLILHLLRLMCSGEGLEYLPFNIQLGFKLDKESEEQTWVQFDLSVPIEYKSELGWIGIGLQNSFDPDDSVFADFSVCLMDGSIYDMHRSDSAVPVKDETKSCIDNFESSYSETEEFIIFSWKRKLDTGDSECDLVLKENWPYKVIYELGDVDGNGNLIEAYQRYSGFEYFVLREVYFDVNDDERGKYGPWSSGFVKNPL